MTNQILEEEFALQEITLNFRAMNTDIQLLIFTPGKNVEAAVKTCQEIQSLFELTEASLSRFRQSSELVKLNTQGFIENASEILYESVKAASKFSDFSGGVFDPTILDSLKAAGYDRSFELLQESVIRVSGLGKLPSFTNWRIELWRGIELDEINRNIKLPPGVQIDLGGIAKGTTVDRGVELVRQAGFRSFMLSAGGDMFLNGSPPQDRRGWSVVIQNPLMQVENEIASLMVFDKGVATSAITGRRWLKGGQVKHHLIDPRSGQPANNGIASVTVVADSVQMADVMAKTCLILGTERTQESGLIRKAGLGSVLFVTMEGTLIQL